MSRNLLSRYIWIIDTIRRHGKITRTELDRLWLASEFSDGSPLPRRTFYNYRNAIAELFKINIECSTSTFEYYIDEDSDPNTGSVTEWILDTASLSNAMTDAREIADRVFLEEVPSSRRFLQPVMGAMKENMVMRFAYSPFSRTGVPKPVTLEPYFLKIFKLRWYVTGRNVKENVIKTYALDRMSSLKLTGEKFEVPADFVPQEYFRDAFGIVFSQGEVKKIVLRVDARQAKYFRALPLHHSQSEMIGDRYSYFTYRMRLTQDLVQELLGYGPSVKVEAPAELRAMMVSSLRQSLNNYTEEQNEN